MNETAALVAVLACLALLVRSVRPVPPQHTYVVELLHPYRRTLEPGIHVLIPLLESVRAKLLMAEQSATFGPTAAVTPTTTWPASPPSSTTRSRTRSGRPTRYMTGRRPWRRRPSTSCALS